MGERIDKTTIAVLPCMDGARAPRQTGRVDDHLGAPTPTAAAIELSGEATCSDWACDTRSG